MTVAQKPKQYLPNVPRRWVYGGLGVFAILAIGLLLVIPHYKPLKLATTQEMQQAHQDIIMSYFVVNTTCKQDTRTKTDRIKTFNKYFKVNQYANRAVFRGCNDTDQLLAKNDTGKWVKTTVNIVLSSRQDSLWQKACLIDDITTADSLVRPQNSSIDAHNLKVCDSLSKQSYLQTWIH